MKQPPTDQEKLIEEIISKVSKRFSTDEAVKEAMRKELRNHPTKIEMFVELEKQKQENEDYIKERTDKIWNLLVQVAETMETMREEQIIANNRYDKKLDKHEKRIKKLESSPSRPSHKN